MKHLLLTILLVLTSCAKHEDHETVNPYEDVKARDASYRSQLMDYSIDELFPDRCDRLTFYALYSAFVTWQDLSAYEKSSGQWWRDTQSCLADLDGNGKPDSKSQISFDGLIGVLHHARTFSDNGILFRMRAYGKSHKWIMGEGDRKLTYNPQLLIIINDMLGEHILLKSTHKEHIIASSIWLKMRYSFLNDAELLVLKTMPQTPFSRALIARLKDGNQEKTIEYLRSFPDKLPLEVGIEGWGGCPAWLYWFLLKGVIDGR